MLMSTEPPRTALNVKSPPSLIVCPHDPFCIGFRVLLPGRSIDKPRLRNELGYYVSIAVATLGLVSTGAARQLKPPPLFFLQKTDDLVIAITDCHFCSGVTPIYFFPEKLTNFFAFCSSLSVNFIHFTRVSPPVVCHPAPFLPVRPRLSTILCKFAHNFFFVWVSPPGGCHPVRSVPRPSQVTPLVDCK